MAAKTFAFGTLRKLQALSMDVPTLQVGTAESYDPGIEEIRTIKFDGTKVASSFPLTLSMNKKNQIVRNGLSRLKSEHLYYNC